MKKQVVLVAPVVVALSLLLIVWQWVLAAPTLTNNGISINEGSVDNVISNSELSVDDPAEPGAEYTYTVNTAPVSGTLLLNGVALTTNDIFTQTSIDNGWLTYSHDDSEGSPDTFGFSVDSITGTVYSNETFTIIITGVVDEAPSINAAGPFPIPENSDVDTPVGTITADDVEVDQGYDTLTYNIEAGNDNNAFKIITNNKSGELQVNNSDTLDFENQESFTLTVSVADSSAASSNTDVIVNLSDVDEPPEADDQTMNVPEDAINNDPVDTVNASDPEGESLSYSITNTPCSNVFSIDGSGQITVTDSNQLDHETNPAYSCTVDIADPANNTTTITVTINVTDANEAPSIDNGGASFTVPENSNNGTAVTPDVDASDPDDGDTLTYSLTNTPCNTVFDIDNNGTITVIDSSQLDFEDPNKDDYSCNVEVRDSGNLPDTATITITVTNVNEDPTIDDDTFNIPENAADNDIVDEVTASDPENDTLTYSITSSPCNNVFAIDGSGRIRLANTGQLNHENKASYNCNVQVEDTANNTASATITINVTDVNEAPSVNDQSFPIDENAPNGSNVDTVAASDPDADDAGNLTFAIINQVPEAAFDINNSSGLIEVSDSSQLDFETNPTFTVTVRVTDSGGPGGSTLSDEADITINLNNVNEAPTIPGGQTLSVPENSDNGTAVGTVTASDQDAGDTLTYTFTNAPCNTIFNINNSGAVTVANGSQLNHEATSSYGCTLEVKDSGDLPDTATVTINVTDVNEKPSVTAGQTFSVVGFADNGTVVGTVAASDPDDGDTLSYAITGGNDGNAFRINANNGRLIVNNSDALDFETRPTFNLSIRVSDSGSLNDTKTVVVTLTEPPVYLVMLPLVANNYRPPDEPNNACGDAHNIVPNFTYNYFLPNDNADWYVFQLTNPANLTVTLSNFTPIQGQIILYRGMCGSLTFIRNNGNFQSTKIISVGVQPAGTYYVRIIIDGPKSTTPYNLRIDAP